LAYGEHRGNFDLDFQHRWQRTENQEYIWGLGYRFTHDEIRGTPILSYHPDRQQDRLYSAFVQGEFKIPLNPLGIFGVVTPQEPNDWIRLTIGSKFEKYGSSDLEIQPTIRALWAANNQHSLWGSISKAVRIPSRSDKDINFFLFHPLVNGVARGTGNPDFLPEELISYELGYRFYPNQDFLLDTNVFFHDYNQLRTIEIVSLSPIPTLSAGNQMYGEVYGLELSLHWQVSKTWKLISTYSFLDTQLHRLATSTDTNSESSEEGNNPHHQATLRSLFNPYRNVEFDMTWYYVDNVPSQRATSHYTRFDVRLGWKPMPRLTLSLGGRNLFDQNHNEFGVGVSGGILFPNEVPRTWYLQLGYEF
jgi:iron complex outermembrane receptor protein